MNDNLPKLLKQAYSYPESRLADDIWRVIELKSSRNLKIKSLLYSFIGVLSFGGFILVFISLKQKFASSGFFEYASIAFSSGSLFATYWKEYLLSLVDALPVASLGTSFFLLFSMLISIRKALLQYKNRLSLI